MTADQRRRRAWAWVVAYEQAAAQTEATEQGPRRPQWLGRARGEDYTRDPALPPGWRARWTRGVWR